MKFGLHRVEFLDIIGREIIQAWTDRARRGGDWWWLAGRTCHDLLLRGGELIIAKQAEGAGLANYTCSLSQLSDNL